MSENKQTSNLNKENISIILNYLTHNIFILLLDNIWINGIADVTKSIKIKGNWFTGVYIFSIYHITDNDLICTVQGYKGLYTISFNSFKKYLI